LIAYNKESYMGSIFRVLLGIGLSVLSGWAAAQTVEYIHTDALGSIVAVTDASGNVIERREYEPYGAQLTPVVQDGPGYTGHVQDAATGLTYMQQRYYDPQIGLFLSVDPVTAYSNPVGQFHRYRYANNNPYKFTDPDGRAVTCGEKRCSGEVNTITDAIAVPITITIAYGGRLVSNAIASSQSNESSESDSAGGNGGPDSVEGLRGASEIENITSWSSQLLVDT
jgi:RHS repeat-associated protein